MNSKRSISGFSQESSSGAQAAFKKSRQPQRVLSTASPNSSSTIPASSYKFHEELDLVYDKILEDEDKILLAQKRKARAHQDNSDSEESCVPSDLISEDEEISLVENLSDDLDGGGGVDDLQSF
jgi:phospholipid N-methyltransferase